MKLSSSASSWLPRSRDTYTRHDALATTCTLDYLRIDHSASTFVWVLHAWRSKAYQRCVASIPVFFHYTSSGCPSRPTQPFFSAASFDDGARVERPPFPRTSVFLAQSTSISSNPFLFSFVVIFPFPFSSSRRKGDQCFGHLTW